MLCLLISGATYLLHFHAFIEWAYVWIISLSFVSKSIADSAALTTVTDAVGSEQILTKCGYVDNSGMF